MDRKTTVPVVREQVQVGKERVERDVEIEKKVEPYQVKLDQPLVRERVVVETVAKNERIDGAPPKPREENGVGVVSVTSSSP